MRKIIIASALGGVLTFAGLAMAVIAMNRNVIPITAGGPVHPVTDPMNASALSMARTAAPDFKLPDIDGNLKTLKVAQDGKPTFIYFIKDGCPCSTEAEPLYQNLYAHLNPDEQVRVNFVGIIGSDEKIGKAWSMRFNTPYTVLCAPDHKVMKAYKSPNSAYGVLLDGNGKIVKQWPGYSKRILLEINTMASELLGEMPKKFDPTYAPLEDSSGCSFDEAPIPSTAPL